MRLERSFTWSLALVISTFGVAHMMGCTAEAALGGKIESPQPSAEPTPAPPPDADGDGILDADDKCVNEAEDGKAPDAKDGCPNKDEDNDGVALPDDKCPDKPETKNGFEDEDGCPDVRPLVMLVGTRVEIDKKIQFKKGSATIEKDSDTILDAIAEVMKKHTDIGLVEVGGHASKEGDANKNTKLTQQRVDAVVAALVKRGVGKERFMAQGYGSYCAVDAGDSEESLEKNRRVEFKILWRAGKETDEVGKRGCEAAAAKGIKPKALPKMPEPKPAPAAPAAPTAPAAPAGSGAAPAGSAAPPAASATPPKP